MSVGGCLRQVGFGALFGGIQDLFEAGVNVRYGGFIVELSSQGMPFRQSCRASFGEPTCMLNVELNNVVVATKSVGDRSIPPSSCPV